MVTASLSSSVSNAVIAVSRYSGVSALGNVVSANTLGTSGGCSGGSDSNSYAVSLATTAPNSVIYGVVAKRNRSHTPGAGYTEQIEATWGSGGNTASLAIEDQEFSTVSSKSVSGSFNSNVDWALVAVELTSAPAVPTPDISVNPTSHSYGAVVEGDSASQSFVVSNQGSATLNVSSTSLAGPNASEFNIDSGGGTFSLLPGATETIVVGFYPTGSGARSASLSLTSNDPDESFVSVSLTGTGALLEPDISVSSSSHDYGNVAVGESSNQIFTVTNDGTSDLTVSTTTLSGPNAAEFNIDSGAGPFILTPGASQTVMVGFYPSTVGAKLASLDLTSNDPDEGSVSVSLTGTGSLLEPDITTSPSSHDYGSVVLGQSASQSFTITNDGTSDLTVSATALSGANAAEFNIDSGAGPFILTPGASQTVMVGFYPSTVGAKLASLDLTSDDPDEGNVSVSLTGTGSNAPPPGVSLEQIDTGGAGNTSAVATLTPVTSVNGDVYLAAISYKKNTTVTSVTGMGLSWTEIGTQCGGRSATGVSLWVTTGSGSSFDGVVTASLSSSVSNAVIAVSRYSGVSVLGNVVSANTLGTSGGCSGGSDSSSYAVSLATTAPNSVIYGVVAKRNRSHTPGAGYTEQIEASWGSGGNTASLAIEDQEFSTVSSKLVNGSFNSNVDWALVAVELLP